jgi:iron complex outermembrane receptor protein
MKTINMKRSAFRLKASVIAMSSVIAAVSSGGAFAQDDQLEEVVVTGSLIRGTEVTGTKPISLDVEAIQSIGAANTNEILATIPQVTNFFNGRTEEDPRASSSISITRPNLRNMPGFNSASGSVTLLLMDGHRIAPVGVLESSIDADVIMGSVIERVDIVTDGGSSLYGADAVAGVINFMTKDSFDGVRIDLNGGQGDEYNAHDVALTAGTSWDDGSVMVALSTSERDGFLAADRDWYKTGFYSEDGSEFEAQTATQCGDAVGQVKTYAWNGTYGVWYVSSQDPRTGIFPVGTPCDRNAQGSALQDQSRDNAFLSIKQSLSDSVSFGMKGYYSKRVQLTKGGARGGTLAGEAPTGGNYNAAAFSALAPDADTAVGLYTFSAGYGFDFSPSPANENKPNETIFETMGISADLDIDLSNGWQVRNTLYYGTSENDMILPGANSPLISQAIEDGDLDIFDIAATDAALVSEILDFEGRTRTEHSLTLLRSVADGKVMDLPGGELRVAVGFEYAEDETDIKSASGPVGSIGGVAFDSSSRDSTSLFAELAVPVTSNFDLSLSVRRDDYSDFGATTNPSVGFDFRATDWLTFFGKWSESFNAPTALDNLAVYTGRPALQTVADTTSADVRGEWDGEGAYVVILDGTLNGLEPQTAETYSFGFEAQPAEGLEVSVNYYDIEFNDILGQLGVPSPATRLAFPEKYIWNPTAEVWGDLLSGMANPTFGEGIIDNADPTASITYIYDRRTSNFSQAEIDGFDFAVSYQHMLGNGGTMMYGVSGNKQLTFDLTQGVDTTDQLAYNPDMWVQGVIAYMQGGFTGRINLRHTAGFDADPGAANQSSVDSYLTTNLFLGYDFADSTGMWEGVTLRVNIDNVFDEDPPEYRLGVPNLAFSSFTLGRVFKVGISKTF